jgi:hypothetical protein
MCTDDEAGPVDTTLLAALIGLPVAIAAGVVVDRLRRRAERREAGTALLEISRVDFQRDDESPFPTIDITVRNLRAVACVIKAAEIRDVQLWSFPPHARPSHEPVSWTYDADLSEPTQCIRLSQVVGPLGADRFAIRCGTTKPVYPYVGHFLYLFAIDLILNDGERQHLGRFLAHIPQPVIILGLFSAPLSPAEVDDLVGQASALAAQLTPETRVDPRAKDALAEIKSLSEPADPEPRVVVPAEHPPTPARVARVHALLDAGRLSGEEASKLISNGRVNDENWELARRIETNMGGGT